MRGLCDYCNETLRFQSEQNSGRTYWRCSRCNELKECYYCESPLINPRIEGDLLLFNGCDNCRILHPSGLFISNKGQQKWEQDKTVENHQTVQKVKKTLSQQCFDTKQGDLNGQSQNDGRAKYFQVHFGNASVKQVMSNPQAKENYAKSYVMEKQSVFSLLKINGYAVVMGRNQKAQEHLLFYGVGRSNQKGIKDNFHAEDWGLSSFIAKFYEERERARKEKNHHYDYDLEQFLSENEIAFDPKDDTVIKKQVFSLRINFSPCLGCIRTIESFNRFLKDHLGSDNYIFRIKFLRPYVLKKNIKNSYCDTAIDFAWGIRYLISQGIPVRIQPEGSYQKMYGAIHNERGQIKTEWTKTKKEISDKTKAIKRIDPKLYDYSTKTWKELGFNRKLPEK